VIKVTTQLSIFGDEVRTEVDEPTAVRLGSRVAQVNLKKQRREALKRLMEILGPLEGKDVYIGSYHAGGRHFWFDNLKCQRLQVEHFPFYSGGDPNYIPSVIVLWGCRGACVRIFTKHLVAVREQEYQGYWHWLLDFRNGFWESPIDTYNSHYACLTITRFKD